MKLAVLAGLEQRISLRYAMPPMTSTETASYISHHIKLAGRSDALFSDDAAALIHATARGYPRADLAHGKGSPGRAQLYIDGQLTGQSDFPVTTPIAFNPGGLSCGHNPGSAVISDCQAPFPYTGTLRTVTVDLSGDLITDTDSEMRMAMVRQ
jgi:hypothetical protein